MENTRRNRTKRGIFIAIALVLIVYLIGATYARYSTVGQAAANVEIAEWHVTLTPNDGGAALTSTSRNITFTVQNNNAVVAGKIAPAVTATAEVELDLTGTEVAVDFTPTIGTLTPTNFASSDKISLTASVDGSAASSTQVIPLPGGSAFTSTNGKKTVALTLTWENDDTNNADDTTAGIAGGTLTVPVTLTVAQHIGNIT